MNAAAACSATQMYAALQVFSCLEMTAYMCPRDTIIQDIVNFRCDYIIVGAGASGSVIAKRLTENPHHHVCLIEAGGDPPFETAMPGLYAYAKQKSILWDYQYEADPENPTFHQDHAVPLTLGKMLGGTSNLDYLYERGNPRDYDEWAEIAKDKSWNYESVLRSFIKSEHLYDAVINNSKYAKYHGTHGYLGVSKQYSERVNKYLDAFVSIGLNELIDFDGRNVTGIGRVFLNLANDIHQSAAFSVLYEIRNRINLKVLKHRTAVRITMDSENTANGVCFVDELFVETCLTARKKVVLAAGAINTAKILLQSGIGPKKHLTDRNIKCIMDLPVGRNLIAQPAVPILYRMGTMTQPPENLGPYVFPIPQVLGRVSIDTAFAEYRTLSNVLSPSQMLHYCLSTYGYTKELCQMFYNQASGREILLTEITQYKPKSRGFIELRSSNFLDAPIIENGFMSNGYDVERMMKYISDFARIRNSPFFKSVNAIQLKPEQCLRYKPNSEEYYKCYINGMRGSDRQNNIIGTCSMGSVVDNKLSVLGIKNLLVADSGVIPIPISGSSYITNLMIGEKAAEIIKAEEKELETAWNNDFNGAIEVNSVEDLDKNGSGKSKEKHSGESKGKNSGESKENHSGESKEKQSGESKEKHSGESKEKHSGENKEKHSGESKEKHSGESKEKHSGESKEKHSDESKEKHSSESKDKHIGESKEKHSGESKEKHSGESIEKHSGESKEKHSGESKEKHSGESNENHSGESKENHSGESKEKQSGESKEKHSGESKEKHSGENKEKHSGENKEKHSGESKEKHSGESKEKHSGESKEKHSGESLEKHSGESKEKHSGESKEKHSGESNENHSGESKENHSGECKRNHSGESKEKHSGESKEKHSGESKEKHSGESKEKHSGESKEKHSGESKENHSGESKENHSGESKEKHSGESK